MLSFYLIWSTSYVILLWLLSRTWRVGKTKKTAEKNDFRISLLIPFRNEIENLPSLLIEIQKLQSKVSEVILIDDHSEDGSLEFLEGKINYLGNVKLIKNRGFGKKEALTIGVLASSGEIICCSDADCRFQINWVETITSPFQTETVQLVAGPVMSAGSKSFFSGFQQIEWGSILLTTNFFFGRSKPLMCSGANLAYRKSAFEAVKGYEGNIDQLSGDDEFLLKKIIKKFSSEACAYIIHPNALVLTESHHSFPTLLQQRIRWASKWRAHDSITHSLVALFSFMIQLIWIGSGILLFKGEAGVLVYAIVWFSKILTEWYVLSKPLKTYLIPQKAINFVGASLLHPIFVLIVGVVAWRGKFSWKGRSNERSVILAK